MTETTPVIGRLQQEPYSEADARRELALTQAEHAPTLLAFHGAFYRARHTWTITRFQGVPVMKPPTDLWTYHELMEVLRPTIVIETGTAFGGSALLFASQPSVRRVFTIDIEPQADLPLRAPITYLLGSSTDPALRAAIRQQLTPEDRVMVVLDSNHHQDHVRAELELFAPLVSVGQLLVVEDTNLGLLDVTPDGPDAALRAWLPLHPEFQVEPLGDRFLMTFNTWLRRAP